MNELVEAVKRHAAKNYERGWDIVIECYTDAEIAEEIKGAKTPRGAINKMGSLVSLKYERRREIESTIW